MHTSLFINHCFAAFDTVSSFYLHLRNEVHLNCSFIASLFNDSHGWSTLAKSDKKFPFGIVRNLNNPNKLLDTIGSHSKCDTSWGSEYAIPFGFGCPNFWPTESIRFKAIVRYFIIQGVPKKATFKN